MSPEERANALAEVAESRPALLRIAQYLSRSSATAEDLVQATLLSAVEHIDAWQGRGPVKNWLIRILTNQYRREARIREFVADPATWEQLADAAGWAADADLERTERVGQVQQAVLKLFEDDREILLLRDVEEIGGDEAAEMLGLTVPAMKSRLHRARLRLLAAVREESTVNAHEQSGSTMTCMEVLQCLGEYVDGCLNPSVVATIEAHVSSCDRCQLFGQRYTRLLSQLRQIQPLEEGSR